MACCASCWSSTARPSLKARSEIGYPHTGIEKTCEALTYSQAITVTDRLDYLAPLSNNLGYCLAVEKLLGSTGPSARSTFACCSRN